RRQPPPVAKSWAATAGKSSGDRHRGRRADADDRINQALGDGSHVVAAAKGDEHAGTFQASPGRPSRLALADATVEQIELDASQNRCLGLRTANPETRPHDEVRVMRPHVIVDTDRMDDLTSRAANP